MNEKLTISTLTVITVMFTFLSMVLLITFNLFPSSIVMQFQTVKDVLFLLLFVALISTFLLHGKVIIYKKTAYLYVTMLIYFMIMLGLFVVSPAGLMFKVYNLRRICVLFLVLFVCLYMKFNDDVQRKYENVLSFCVLSLFIFGVADVLMPDYFWNNVMKLPKFWNSNITQQATYETIYQVGRAYSSDLYFLLGRKVRRMMSFYLEPTTLAAFFAVTFTYFYITGRKRLIVIASFLGGILTLSKFFILTVIVTIFFKYFKRPSMLFVYAFTGGTFFLAKYMHANFASAHGSLSHLFGYYTGFTLLKEKTLGFGLGMAGQRGQMGVSTINGDYGGESGIGNIMAQIGIAGLIHLSIIWMIMYYSTKFYRLYDDNIYLSLYVMMFCYYISFLFSASALGFSGNVFYFMFAGLILSRGSMREI